MAAQASTPRGLGWPSRWGQARTCSGQSQVLQNVDFGHTDPQLIVPLGVRAEVDCEVRRLRLLEPAEV